MHAVVHDTAVAGGPSSLWVDSYVKSCIQSKTSGRSPLLVLVCMFSECTVQLLLGVACEACGLRPHCLVLALNRAMYSTNDTTIEGVFYSVQLCDTVVVLPMCIYAWFSKQWAW